MEMHFTQSDTILSVCSKFVSFGMRCANVGRSLRSRWFIVYASICSITLTGMMLFFLNNSRGQIVDSSAVRRFLNSQRDTTNADFQPVSNANRTYVYSAYLEAGSRNVRVVGFTQNTTKSSYCILWYLNRVDGDYYRSVYGSVQHIAESHKFRYTANYIICSLPDSELPDAVSIVEHPDDLKPSNILPIRVKAMKKHMHNFSVCLAPIQQNYENTDELIEWLENVRLLGATNVFVYVQNATSDVVSVLNFYQAKGLVTLLRWSLPSIYCNQAMKQLHYCGQMVSINDCIYRNKGKSRFVASFDLDEMIIPQHDEDYTWNDMLKRLPQKGTFIFSNTFFLPLVNTNKINNEKAVGLRIMRRQIREELIYPSFNRSKWIVNTEQAVTMGIHFSWALSNSTQYKVPHHTGLLHHYRKNSVVQGAYNPTMKLHKAAEKYHKLLQPRVHHVHKMLKHLHVRTGS